MPARLNVPEIRGVLFDVGGVLIRTPFEMIAQRGLVDVAWRGPFDPASDSLFRQVADGSITERAYWKHRSEEVAHLLGLPDGVAAMLQVFAAPETDVVRHEIIDLATDLEAAGFATGILTNDLAKFHGEHWREDLPSLTRFDVRVDLSHTSTLKPHPQSFRLGTEAMGLEPADVLFVDDQPVNIAGANDAGLVTLLFDVTDVVGSVDRVRAAAGLAT